MVKALSKKTHQDYLRQLKELQSPEIMEDDSHMGADSILCKILNELGLEDIVKEWEKVGKWYS